MNEQNKKYIKAFIYFVLSFLLMFSLIKIYSYLFLTEVQLDIGTVENIARLR